ncbi:glycosyltransferase family 2 protein [Methylobacterium durans]|uniref:glycosyltransferase family 2 protein n=1 Tax=Methylobacterium durans TaxID=2202825 RepID=UPI0013A5BAFF|nr:glycosyltransferase family 2 protein [Methylobacterium durans]
MRRIVASDRAPSVPATQDAPAIAVVIPVYRQPHFLIESVASALRQSLSMGHRIVIVDDGCPLPETRALGLAFALADPHVHVIRTPNRGLSAARNAGIDYALSCWPGIEALYMLDADNRLTPRSLEIGLSALTRHPEADWVYPQLSKFGMGWAGHVDVPVSPLHTLLAGSFMEASSVIRARVFAAGLRYDKTMRAGYEDWEFWIQAYASGFRGICEPAMGLDYRYRPESMVRNAARQRPVLLSALRQRHPSLFAARTLLGFEQAHHPRYGLVAEAGLVRFTDWADRREVLASDDLADGLARSRAEPEGGGLPPFLVFADPDLVASLSRARILQSTLRRLEGAVARGAGWAGLALTSGQTSGRSEETPVGDKPAMILVASDRWADLVAGVSDGEIEMAEALAAMAWIDATLPPDPSEVTTLQPDARVRVRRALLTCRTAVGRSEPPKRWHWQTRTLFDAAELVETLRTEIGGAPLSNLARGSGQRLLGLVLDEHSLQGLAVARGLSGPRGSDPTRVHLLHCGPLAGLAERVDLCEVESLDGLTLPEPGKRAFRFHGEPFDLPEPDDPAWREIRGALAGFDTILIGVPRLFPILAECRAKGTRTIVYRPEGGWPDHDTRLVLAFEHATDALIVESEDIAARLAAQGFPRSKIALPRGGVAVLFPDTAGEAGRTVRPGPPIPQPEADQDGQLPTIPRAERHRKIQT